MRSIRLQESDRAIRPGALCLLAGGLLGFVMLASSAMAQPIGEATTLDKVHVVSTETHQFALTTSTDKKLVSVPAQPEGRTISGEIACDMQTQAVLQNWYPFRYYLYKKVGGQLSVIGGGGLSTNNKTYSYTATKADETSNATYLFSAHLNHAQVTGQCSLTVKITEVVQLDVAPQPMRRLPVPESPKLQRIPRPPSE
jgi:hypothetical protein